MRLWRGIRAHWSMMIAIAGVVVVAFFFNGCAGNIISTISMPARLASESVAGRPDEKEVYEVSSKSDALVEITRNGVKITVDNRGRPGFFESLLGAIFLRSPDVNIGSSK